MGYLEKFWVRVERSDGCWLWRGLVGHGGPRGQTLYGMFTTWSHNKPTTTTAHRWIYEQTYGSIPKSLVVHHECRTPLCVRPAHLRAVTRRENMILERQEMCSRGHPWTPENTYEWRNGRRCRACAKEYMAAYYQARRLD